jgi:hypothetical protein
MSEKRKQSSDVYAKVKINKISDKTKPQHNKSNYLKKYYLSYKMYYLNPL